MIVYDYHYKDLLLVFYARVSYNDMVRVCTILYVYDRIENSHNLHRKQLSRLLCNIERIICFTFMVFNRDNSST